MEHFVRCAGAFSTTMQDATRQERDESLRRVETTTAIQEGIASAERGELKDADQVYAEMKARYGIQS